MTTDRQGGTSRDAVRGIVTPLHVQSVRCAMELVSSFKRESALVISEPSSCIVSNPYLGITSRLLVIRYLELDYAPLDVARCLMRRGFEFCRIRRPALFTSLLACALATAAAQASPHHQTIVFPGVEWNKVERQNMASPATISDQQNL
jgi:hypothetical protein